MSLLGLPTPPAWMQEASCAQIGVGMADLWFPGKGGHAVEARSVCTRCPVVEQCRQYAIDNNLVFGIWGGMTRDDLRDERAERAS